MMHGTNMRIGLLCYVISAFAFMGRRNYIGCRASYCKILEISFEKDYLILFLCLVPLVIFCKMASKFRISTSGKRINFHRKKICVPGYITLHYTTLHYTTLHSEFYTFRKICIPVTCLILGTLKRDCYQYNPFWMIQFKYQLFKTRMIN